jgi:hypothetical protein
MLMGVDIASADHGQHRCQGEVVPFVSPLLHRRADASQRKNWIAISLTKSIDRPIFDAADCSAEGCRMRSNDKPVVGDMRKRITRRCVSAATGACR